MNRVPGTFKNRPPIPTRDLSPSGVRAEALIKAIGAQHAQRYLMGDVTIMLAREPLRNGGAWIWHLSIAHPHREPTWDEIKTAVYGIRASREILEGGLAFAQVLGKVELAEDWVNVHDNCFHLYAIEDPFA